MELPRSSDHANRREVDKVRFIAARGWAAPTRKLIGPRQGAPSPGPMALGREFDADGALADKRDGHRLGAHAVARDAAGGLGGLEAERRGLAEGSHAALYRRSTAMDDICRW